MNNALPQIFSDEKFIQCINLATLSKGNERYGSIIIRDDNIIGRSFNRAIAHQKFRLERIIRQGMANHAEVEAINDALANNLSIEGADVYCAGFFPRNGNKIFFKEVYTCSRCIPYLEKYGLLRVFTPTPNGWVERTIEEAGEDSKYFRSETRRKRLEVMIGEFTIDMI